MAVDLENWQDVTEPEDAVTDPYAAQRPDDTILWRSLFRWVYDQDGAVSDLLLGLRLIREMGARLVLIENEIRIVPDTEAVADYAAFREEYLWPHRLQLRDLLTELSLSYRALLAHPDERRKQKPAYGPLCMHIGHKDVWYGEDGIMICSGCHPPASGARKSEPDAP